MKTSNVVNDPEIRRHEARVDDLQPDATYVYSVGNGEPGGFSPWNSIRTGVAADQAFRFLYLGDAQNGFESWGKLLETAREHNPEARFMLLAGDLVDRGNERTNWDHFFLRAQKVFEQLPMAPCVGNHEYLDAGPRLFRSFFRMPRNGPAETDASLNWYFEYGDALFVIIDSTRAIFDPPFARAQADWLETTLSRTEAHWKFVMFHHPVYASHPNRESPDLQRLLTPIFDRQGVDMVLQGHDHAYLRTHPIYNGKANTTSRDGVGKGTVYVVSVSGDKYYGQDARGRAAAGFTEVSTYQTIDLDPRQGLLTYQAFDSTGKRLDELQIKKSPSKANSSLAESSWQTPPKSRVRREPVNGTD